MIYPTALTLLMTILGGCNAMTPAQYVNIPSSGFVDSQGLNIYYQRSGRGAPLILVHGWGADTKSNWVDSGWIDLLNPHRTVISIDVRGHGKSDKPHALEPYGYAEMSSDVLAVLDAHNIKTSDFMGYSMGAFMGAYLLGHHSERFSSMILGGIGDETEHSAAQGIVIAQALRAPNLASVTDPTGKAVRRYVEANLTSDLEALAFSAIRMWPEGYPLTVAGPDIGQARLPVLIINGADDHPYVDSADRLAEALPDARHVRILKVDHMTALGAAAFKETVIEFLQQR